MKIAYTLILTCLVSLGTALGDPYQEPAVHVLTEKDTIEKVARKYLGDKDTASEILNFNQIESLDALAAGSSILIPVKIRASSKKVLEHAAGKLEQAEEAAAPEFAADLFARTSSLLDDAKKSFANASYYKSDALANLAAATADQAVETANKNAPVQDQARIIAVSGHVEVNAGKGDQWESVKAGDSLPVNARLRSAELSRADIELADKSTFQIQDSSELSLKDMTRDRRNQKRRTRLNVIMGDITGHITPRENTNSLFHIESLGSVTAIRGTKVRLGADTEKTVRLSVYEGEVNIDAAGSAVTIPENFGTVVKKNKAPEPPAVLPLPPSLLFPDDQSKTAVQRVKLGWESGKNNSRSKQFLIEIARDQAFNEVMQENISSGTPWVSDTLEPGSYFWRISSINPSGLHGESSGSRMLSIIRNLDVSILVSGKPVKKGKQKIVSPHYTFSSKPVSDDTSVVAIEYSVNKADFQPLTSQLVLKEEGKAELSVRAVGADGTKGSVEKMNVYVDATPPSASVAVGPSKENEKGILKFHVALTAEDNTGVHQIEYSVNGEKFIPYEKPIELSPYSDNDLAYRAVDRVNNSTTVREMSFPAEHLPRNKK